MKKNKQIKKSNKKIDKKLNKIKTTSSQPKMKKKKQIKKSNKKFDENKRLNKIKTTSSPLKIKTKSKIKNISKSDDEIICELKQLLDWHSKIPEKYINENTDKKILYITSFNQRIYDISGKFLIWSFLTNKMDADLLICHENVVFDKKINSIDDNIHIKLFNICQYNYLIDWLEKNRSIIPKELNGLADKNDKNIFQNKWRLRASAWFKKTASLNYAYETYRTEYNYFVWIDADCIIKKYIPNKMIDNLLSDYDLIYNYGIYRQKTDVGYENGIIGFSDKNDYIYIQLLVEYYTSEFVKEIRWDDSYILKTVNEKFTDKECLKKICINKNISSYDLAKNSNENAIMNEKKYIFYNYLWHRKGIHTKTVFKSLQDI